MNVPPMGQMLITQGFMTKEKEPSMNVQAKQFSTIDKTILTQPSATESNTTQGKRRTRSSFLFHP